MKVCLCVSIWGRRAFHAVLGLLCTAPLWHDWLWMHPKLCPIAYIVHYFSPGSLGLWSKVVHYAGNRETFGMHLCPIHSRDVFCLWYHSVLLQKHVLLQRESDVWLTVMYADVHCLLKIFDWLRMNMCSCVSDADYCIITATVGFWTGMNVFLISNTMGGRVGVNLIQFNLWI